MKCKICGKSLHTQDSARYPYFCPGCNIGYGPWISAKLDKNTTKAHKAVSAHMKERERRNTDRKCRSGD